jgi:hypothetical protein
VQCRTSADCPSSMTCCAEFDTGTQGYTQLMCSARSCNELNLGFSAPYYWGSCDPAGPANQCGPALRCAPSALLPSYGGCVNAM